MMKRNRRNEVVLGVGGGESADIAGVEKYHGFQAAGDLFFYE